jgi:hypothetical protein
MKKYRKINKEWLMPPTLDIKHWPVGRLDGSAAHILVFIPLMLYLNLQS